MEARSKIGAAFQPVLEISERGPVQLPAAPVIVIVPCSSIEAAIYERIAGPTGR